MDRWGVVGLEGVDTRALALHLREHGEMRGIVAPAASPTAALLARVRADAGPPPAGRPKGFRSHAASARPLKRTAVRIAMLDFAAGGPICAAGGPVGQVRSFSPRPPGRRSGERSHLLERYGAPSARRPGACWRPPGRTSRSGIALMSMLAIAAGRRRAWVRASRRQLSRAGSPTPDGATPRATVVIDEASLKGGICTVSHRNLNDGTVEGVSSERGRFLGVQFSPVPDDDGRPSGLFREFVERMARTGGKRQKAKG